MNNGVDFGSLWDETKSQFSGAYGDLVAFGIAAIESLIVLLLAGFLARRLRSRTQRALDGAKVGANLAALGANAVSIGVYVVAASLVLGLFGASWTALLAVLSVSTLAISLALQDVLKNFVAGVYLLLERPFTIGDRIRVRDVTGSVEGIEIRTTTLRDDNEERIVVPNATIFGEIVTNRSASRLVRTTMTLKHVANTADAESEVRRVLHSVDGIAEPPPRLRVTSLTHDGAEFEVTIWHDSATDPTGEVMRRLGQRFPDSTVATGPS